MKFASIILIATLIVAVYAASTPERTNWYYPFWRQSCTGCLRQGNNLPWCVKVPVNNLVCTSNVSTLLPSCARVTGITQVLGPVRRALVADTLGCNKTSTTSELPSCWTVSAANFADGLLPSSVVVDGSQVLGAVSAANDLECLLGANNTIPSCFTISSSQITGSIPANQITGSVSSANSLTCTSNTTQPISSCFTISANQVTGNIPSSQVTGSIPASQLSGVLNNTVTIDGSQVSGGTIPSSTVFSGSVTTNTCGSIASTCFAGLFVYDTPVTQGVCSSPLLTVVPLSCPVQTTRIGLIQCPALDMIVSPHPTCADSSTPIGVYNNGLCTYTCNTGVINCNGVAAPLFMSTTYICV